MNLSSRWQTILTVFLVVLLVLQLVALPLHEYNLVQQGYTLVRVPLGQWSADTTVIESNGDDYYNVARCDFHHLLHTLSQYETLLFGLVLLGGLRVVLSNNIRPQIELVRTLVPGFGSIALRAPPLH